MIVRCAPHYHNHPDPCLHWTVRGRGRYFECIDDRAGFEFCLRCPWRSDTVDRELFVLARRQAFQLWVVRLSATNRSWVSPFGARPFSLGASPCKACSPPFMVDFIVFSSHFRVLFVLPVGLAQLDVFSFSCRRLECSCHPFQSTKGDISICWALRTAPELSVQVSATFFSLFGVFVDLLSGFSLRRVFLSFLINWSSFPTPPNRKMWLLEPIGSRRGVLSRLRLVYFFVVKQTASGSVGMMLLPKC